MALDSIKIISEAEEKAELKVQSAAAAAAQLIDGKKQVFIREANDKTAKAEAEKAEIIEKAQAQADERAKAVYDETANKCAIMTVRAEKKFDDAAQLIIRKVVGK